MILSQIGFRNLTSVISLMLICGCDGYVENARGTGGAPNTVLNEATGGSATATGPVKRDGTLTLARKLS